jgi:hypothetical protein
MKAARLLLPCALALAACNAEPIDPVSSSSQALQAPLSVRERIAAVALARGHDYEYPFSLPQVQSLYSLTQLFDFGVAAQSEVYIPMHYFQDTTFSARDCHGSEVVQFTRFTSNSWDTLWFKGEVESQDPGEPLPHAPDVAGLTEERRGLRYVAYSKTTVKDARVTVWVEPGVQAALERGEGGLVWVQLENAVFHPGLPFERTLSWTYLREVPAV